MSFLLSLVEFLVEYKLTLTFYSLVFLIVYLNRKRFDVHGNFIFLYRTKVGIKLMSVFAQKAGKSIRAFGYLGVIAGFIGMIITFWFISVLTFKLMIGKTGGAGASPVIPGLPIAGTGLVFPLVTGWIVLFIIIFVHEFSHGVVARAHKIKVKNSGIAFLGPILGAFVEPDEKELSKSKDWVQHSVFAAGPFSNFLTVILIIGLTYAILLPAIYLLTIPSGVILYSQPGLPAEKAGIANNTVVTGINGKAIATINDFRTVMKSIMPGEKVEVSGNDGKKYSVTTKENPDEKGHSYLGVWVVGEKSELRHDTPASRFFLTIVQWLWQMFRWLTFLSVNIGLINLLPIFITDGARMLKVFLERVIKNRKNSAYVWVLFNWISLLFLLMLVFLPFFRWIGANIISLIV